MRPFLTVAEVAERLGRTPTRCYQLARAGELPVVEVGGRLVVPVAALEQWLREKTESALENTHRSGVRGSTLGGSHSADSNH
jgi:excisionase family DNA binding protein